MSSSILPGRLERVGYAVGGARLIDELTLDLEAGPRSIILGPNGAGKSLTLRLAHGLLRPTSGRVVWRRTDPRRQAMVFQRPVLLRRSAAANIDYALKLRGVDRPARARRRDEALSMSGLAALAGRSARVLSAGQQQRLALARAWAGEPEVLFLDEPTANLDPAATKAVEDLVCAIHAAGTKIVMTTHDLAQARRLADEVIFLHHGRLREHALADRFFTAPASAEARAFLQGELVL